jgi:hypothetical protein
MTDGTELAATDASDRALSLTCMYLQSVATEASTCKFFSYAFVISPEQTILVFPP